MLNAVPPRTGAERGVHCDAPAHESHEGAAERQADAGALRAVPVQLLVPVRNRARSFSHKPEPSGGCGFECVFSVVGWDVFIGKPHIMNGLCDSHS